MKKIFALVIAMIMVLGMSTAVFAAEDDDPAATTVSTPSITINAASTSDASKTDTTSYKAWEMLKASIAEDPTSSGATQTGGKVSYYVTTEAAKNALSSLFTFTQVGTESKWYATPNDGLTAQQVVDAFKNYTDAQMTAAFGNPVEFAQSAVGGSANSGTVDAGYYFIKSSLGSNIAIQTLTAVTIDEKNSFVTDEKTLEKGDENSEIGQDIVYTLTVNVPASANDSIVLTDTMGKGLTYKSIEQDSKITGTVSEVTDADGGATKFTITYTAEDIKTLVANGAATITVKVTVTVNGEAAIDTDIPNTLDLKYGNNYEAVPSTVNTQTTKATFDKVDGDDGTKLTGAKFQLLKGDSTTPIALIEVTAGEVYRIATPAEIADAETSTVTEITTTGKTVTINGLDLDETYKLKETEAPAGGYNKLTDPVTLTKNDTTFVHANVKNNKGSVLPSTGGIGTTIFYIIGAILVIGAGVVLVTRRRMNVQ